MVTRKEFFTGLMQEYGAELHKKTAEVTFDYSAHKVFDEMSRTEKWKQNGTVQEYYDSFMIWVQKTGMKESYVIDFFVSGLHPEIEKRIKMFEPKSLSDAYRLAHLQEKTNEIMKRKNAIKNKTNSSLLFPSYGKEYEKFDSLGTGQELATGAGSGSGSRSSSSSIGWTQSGNVAILERGVSETQISEGLYYPEVAVSKESETCMSLSFQLRPDWDDDERSIGQGFANKSSRDYELPKIGTCWDRETEVSKNINLPVVERSAKFVDVKAPILNVLYQDRVEFEEQIVEVTTPYEHNDSKDDFGQPAHKRRSRNRKWLKDSLCNNFKQGTVLDELISVNHHENMSRSDENEPLNEQEVHNSSLPSILFEAVIRDEDNSFFLYGPRDNEISVVCEFEQMLQVKMTNESISEVFFDGVNQKVKADVLANGPVETFDKILHPGEFHISETEADGSVPSEKVKLEKLYEKEVEGNSKKKVLIEEDEGLITTVSLNNNSLLSDTTEDKEMEFQIETDSDKKELSVKTFSAKKPDVVEATEITDPFHHDFAKQERFEQYLMSDAGRVRERLEFAAVAVETKLGKWEKETHVFSHLNLGASICRLQFIRGGFESHKNEDRRVEEMMRCVVKCGSLLANRKNTIGNFDIWIWPNRKKKKRVTSKQVSYSSGISVTHDGRYDLYLGNEQFAVVENLGFWDWTITLKDIKGDVLSEIDRDRRGFGSEVFTDDGQYVILFGSAVANDHLSEKVQDFKVARPLTLSERAVTVVLAISLDNDYFFNTWRLESSFHCGCDWFGYQKDQIFLMVYTIFTVIKYGKMDGKSRLYIHEYIGSLWCHGDCLQKGNIQIFNMKKKKHAKRHTIGFMA